MNMSGKKKTEYIENEDVSLWNNLIKGSDIAYATIYDKYVSGLYTYGCRIHHDEELVKDCLQDLFLNLWKSRQNLGSTNNIQFYLMRSLRREIARKTNKIKEVKEFGTETFENSFEDQLITAEEHINYNKALEVALNNLSERQREAIYLKFYQNMSFEEIALMMDISPRAVYKLIYRAIEVLQKSYPLPPSTLNLELDSKLAYLVFLIYLADIVQ